jgi:glucokinase
MAIVPVLEVGGSHVTAALVDPVEGAVLGRTRSALNGSDPAEPLLQTIASTASRLGAEPAAAWGVAVPGPFDYAAGIGRYHDVGKFTALNGVDVGAELRERISPRPGALRFLNDAAAFGLGEWSLGAARGHSRALCITLGTGVGSAFVDGGRVVMEGPDVPPHGQAHLLTIDGRPLEETVSTRAMVAGYRQAGGEPSADVAEITARAVAGDHLAYSVVETAMYRLGEALGPWLRRFEATVLVVGGGISSAWHLIAPALRRGIAGGSHTGDISGDVLMVPSVDTETAALRGAARHATVVTR